MAAAPTATTECLNNIPPINTTSINGWSTRATAIVGLCVTTVSFKSVGRCLANCAVDVPPSRMTTCPALTNFVAARPIATFPSGASCCRAAKSPTAGEAGRAPPCTRCNFPSAASSRRSLRMVSSDSPSSWLTDLATIWPVLRSKSSRYSLRWRVSMGSVCTNFLDPARFCTIRCPYSEALKTQLEPNVSANPAVEVLNTEVLSDNWYVLREVTFRLRKRDGSWETQAREAYDRGNGATILPYNLARRTVILTPQFRLPTFVNGNESGMLIETCAGLLDKENPSECITRELREETGFEIQNVQKVMEAYMSPGSVTEIVYFFICEYTSSQQITAGGGVEEEDIEVMELTIEEALGKIAYGEIRDGKTIMLLQYAALSIFT